ncbi:MAG: type IV secretion system DNA-binding domain-containing protein [Candidatus Peribacteraceae bacterium]
MIQLLTVLGITVLSLGSVLGLFFLMRLMADREREQTLVFLQILMPKKESKDDKETDSEQFSSGKDFKEVIGVMDHLFQNLSSLRIGGFKRWWKGSHSFSLEFAALAGEILTFVVAPRRIIPIIEKQITSFYPDAVIDEVEDYNIFTKDAVTTSTALHTSKSFVYPIKTYQQLKSDPYNAITNAFSKLKKDEGAVVQIVVKPASTGWQKKLQKEAQSVINPKKGGSGFTWWNPLTWVMTLIDMFTSSDDQIGKESAGSSDRVSQMVEELSKAIDEKANSPGFDVTLRIVSSSSDLSRADMNLEGIVSSFTQFSDVRGNGLKKSKYHSQSRLIHDFIRRTPRRTLLQLLTWKRMLLGTGELASIFHFPSIKYNKIQSIKWQNFKLSPAPNGMPEEGLFLGHNTFRGEKQKVFMKNEDRFRHFYIIGQTGTGKSSIIQLMARQDFNQGKGLCIIDPHGSLIEDLLPYIPRSRADDVIYFNPSDTERPMGLNLLEGKTPEEKDLIALDAMNMMVKMFGEEIFGPRIQDYFRNGCLTLMDDEEEGGAITDLVRLFTDDQWQQYKVTKVKNPIVRSFWEKQMAATGQREKQEMIPYFAAKFGQFTTNTLIRNIVGQTKSAFDIADVMNNGKILLMNLSKGLIGDINSTLLGLITVNKIQVAAMRRQREEASKRRDFFLYIDEFQNFVTPSIESILSEARKYRLGLILAHQYLDQLEKESKLAGAVSLKGAVFGNVGTMMFYKIGPQDAEVGSKEMAPVFSEQDLVNMEAFKGCMKLSIDGQPSRPFSIEVPKPWLEKSYPKDAQAAEAFKQLSRLKYGRDKEFVSREILRRIGT